MRVLDGKNVEYATIAGMRIDVFREIVSVPRVCRMKTDVHGYSFRPTSSSAGSGIRKP